MLTAQMYKLYVIVLSIFMCVGVEGVQFPVKVNPASPRMLVDQNSAPFLLVGDAPHSLLVNLSQSDAAFYLADRGANGFNSLWVELLCVPYTGGRANGSLLNGTLPFTGNLSNGEFDLSTPNEAYFSYVDTIIKMAGTNGLQILLDPLDTGGLTQTAVDNGVAKCRAYGQYLGNRYKNFPNLVWLSGNDFQGWRTAANDAAIMAIALGIKDNDTNHLQTVELDYYISSSLDDANWKPIVGLNLAYTYYPTYVEVLHAYQQSTNTPVFMGEEHYEFETVGDPNSGQELGTPLVLRRQEYWTMLSGAAGQIYGNGYTWPFKSGWKNNLDSPGVTQLKYGTALFTAYAWYNLVPDVNHTFLTSGYGTYSTSGAVSANNYVTAAVTKDGTLGMAYLPNSGTVTINLAAMSGAVSAQWYDPENGTYAAISGSPFANTGTHSFSPPGNNSGGDPDWVLVLTAVASPLQILTGSLPSATTGSAYSSQILALGGSPPYSWSLTPDSPSLPPSLVFSTKGVLSGVPTIAGIFTLMVQVLDSTNASATKNFAILITTSDTTAPSAPSGLVAGAVSGSQINLSWSVSTDNVGVAGYLVERSLGAGSTVFTQIVSVTGTNDSDTGLLAGMVYNYRVRATDAGSNLSGYSSVASATTSSTPPLTGLAAAYGLNEGSGTTVADASGNGDTGTISGATWTTSGKYGKALSFNGTSSYVNLGNPASLKLTGSMTLEAWVKVTGNPYDDGQIIAKSDSYSPLVGWQFKTSPDTGNRTFGIGVSPDGNSITQRYSKTILSLNTWYHVAGVYNSSAKTLDIYVNGVLDDGVLNGTVPSLQFDPNTNVTIGRRSGGFYFKGTIDDVRIYSSALNQTQIQSDMNSAVVPLTTYKSATGLVSALNRLVGQNGF